MSQNVISLRRRGAITLGATAIAMWALVAPALAHDAHSPDGAIQITDVWMRATPAGAAVATGYLKITNAGKESDRLVGGTLARAETIAIDEMSMQDGVMKMQRLEHGVEIKPGETVEFKPGGFHMMFVGLTEPVKQGDRITGTLIFQRAGSVPLHYHAMGVGATMAPADQMDHSDHAKQ